MSRTQADGVAYFPPLGRILLALDGAEHTAVRGPAVRALTPRRVGILRGLVRGRTERLAAELFAADGEKDFMEVFATPYALAVIADLIDIPDADREQFLGLARGMFAHGPQKAGEATTALTGYLFGHVLARKEAPGDIVLASRDAANLDPRAFSDPETVDFRCDIRRHLGFGRGPHRCIGADLATASFEEAGRTLPPRLPGLRADERAATWKRDRVRDSRLRAPHLLADRILAASDTPGRGARCVLAAPGTGPPSPEGRTEAR